MYLWKGIDLEKAGLLECVECVGFYQFAGFPAAEISQVKGNKHGKKTCDNGMLFASCIHQDKVGLGCFLRGSILLQCASSKNNSLLFIFRISENVQDGLTGSAWGDWANYTASPLR